MLATSTKIFLKEKAIQLLTLDYFFIKRVIKKELHLKNGQKLLDLGCGTGILSSLFSPRSYVGIDIDKAIIDYAKKRHSQYSFLQIDSSLLTYKKSAFDAVLIAGVIHHLEQDLAEKTLQNVRSILNANGTVLAIEAIPPLNPFNLPGSFFRAHDHGHHILSFLEYKNLFSQFFAIKKSYKQKGGIFDYAVFILTKLPGDR